MATRITWGSAGVAFVAATILALFGVQEWKMPSWLAIALLIILIVAGGIFVLLLVFGLFESAVSWFRQNRHRKEGAERRQVDRHRFNELIEQGDRIAQGIAGGGSADTSDSTITWWRTQVEILVETSCSESLLTDFKTARHPDRPNRMAMLPTALWERLNRVMAQVEVLRRCRDSRGSAQHERTTP